MSSGEFFSSRWIDRPAQVTELAGGLPLGFRAAGVACGIKPSGNPDLGMIVSSAAETRSSRRTASVRESERACASSRSSCSGVTLSSGGTEPST